jgi:enediyne biosynthesis protein E4
VRSRVRSSAAPILAALLMLASAAAARPPQLDSPERDALARSFRFQPSEIPLPPGLFDDGNHVREVAPSVHHIRSWISSVGASAALGDISGDGLPNDLCIVDPRADVPVLHSLTEPPAYDPIVLIPKALPLDSFTAPMGCRFADLDASGTTDIIVYYWGRSPVLFLRTEMGGPVRQAFAEHEMVDPPQIWNTNALLTADLDGDGRVDVVVGNYFPDGARVLDPFALDDIAMEMQDSMSRAFNGGRNRVLRNVGPRAVGPGVRFVEQLDAWPEPADRGWTLALGATDLDGDLLPEIYVANDFGPDRLLHNRSRPGLIRLAAVTGPRTPTTPASKRIGHGSFKGMGVDFGDIGPNGLLDVFVSNIATDFALHESHYTFVNTDDPDALGKGRAPFRDESEKLGTSRGGWGWDAKFGDFDNSGQLEIVQATGFLRGRTNRWPELQELAMGNDSLLRRPAVWPRFADGDGLSGDQPNLFYVAATDGRFHDLAAEVGLGQPQITRGIATADIDGDGRLDLVFANQWEPSTLYRNRCNPCGSFLGLDLLIPVDPSAEGPTKVLEGRHSHLLPGRSAVGTSVVVHTRTAVQRSFVDGGGGHSGQRGPGVHFGLGNEQKARASIAYRDAGGVARRLDVDLSAGWHTLLLGTDGEAQR